MRALAPDDRHRHPLRREAIGVNPLPTQNPGY